MTARRRQDLGIFGFALLIAAAVLFFATRSSPAYPINDWCDANIYLSIGKGMSQGQVVYRDLYDHKGPLLYFMHMLCAFIRFEDFFGVYVMETLLCASFLFLSHKVICLYGARKAAWAALPVLALMVYTSVSFAEGDSAEEMCMPLMMGMIYLTLRFLRSGDASMKKGTLVMHGVLAGCIFWIKFTIMGVPAGLLLALFIRHAVRREWKECGRMVLWVAAGFALSTMPWILYFGFTHGIGEWLGVYLYDNLFLYGSTGLGLMARAKTMIKLALHGGDGAGPCVVHPPRLGRHGPVAGRGIRRAGGVRGLRGVSLLRAGAHALCHRGRDSAVHAGGETPARQADGSCSCPAHGGVHCAVPAHML